MTSQTLLIYSLLSCSLLADIQEEQEPLKAITLFDGKTLDGWKIVGGNAEFKIENGCIIGTGRNVKENTFLRTEKEFGDFDFTYEFKFDDLTGNSGLMFRALQKAGENGRVFGYQSEADNTKRAWTAGLYDEARRGWLFPIQKKPAHKDHREWFSAQGNKIFHWSDWNTIRIRCQGNHIQTWLNGVKRVDFVDADPKNDTRSGFIGLQVHAGASCHVRWRNLILTPLTEKQKPTP